MLSTFDSSASSKVQFEVQLVLVDLLGGVGDSGVRRWNGEGDVSALDELLQFAGQILLRSARDHVVSHSISANFHIVEHLKYHSMLNKFTNTIFFLFTHFEGILLEKVVQEAHELDAAAGDNVVVFAAGCGPHRRC